ncbi:hypothetical protein L1887_11508 [Cichorium endivia]|nr:hypothetical protein L1887_11508 [Cichorium endivia]
MPMGFRGGGEERTEIKTKLAIMFAIFVLATVWSMHYFLPDGSGAGSAKQDSVSASETYYGSDGKNLILEKDKNAFTYRDEATVANAAVVIGTACMTYFHDETKVSRAGLVIENVFVAARLAIMFRAYFKAFLRKLSERGSPDSLRRQALKYARNIMANLAPTETFSITKAARDTLVSSIDRPDEDPRAQLQPQVLIGLHKQLTQIRVF